MAKNVDNMKDKEEAKIIEDTEPEIKEEIIEGDEEVLSEDKPSIIEKDKTYTVEIGIYDTELFANLIIADLKYKGFNAIKEKNVKTFTVHCGSYSIKRNAENLISRLNKIGYKPTLK